METGSNKGERGEHDYVFCPVCGKTCHDRVTKVAGVAVDTIPYFDSIEWDPKKPLGVRLRIGGRIGGRGRIEKVGYFQPEDRPELFAPVKARLLTVLAEWVQRGWTSAEEVGAALPQS